mmetsp:Transcript_23425/g.31021  ORF Transcript_23425/g.31021 Transcript_23425/m.31021 type:complete len:121 (-) Transcript_23425:8041-8403(-)
MIMMGCIYQHQPSHVKLLKNLLGTISHFIVLQNSDNDLFVLIPGCALPRRLHTDGSHLSVQVVLDRRKQDWIDNIGEVRCYHYPVHNSKAFLFTPSLASSMYLNGSLFHYRFLPQGIQDG